MSVANNPLFQMRALLDGYVEGDASDFHLFFSLFDQLQDKIIPELGNRLVRPSTGAAVKRLIHQAAVARPSAMFAEPLRRGLSHESDISVFESGCRALSAMNTPESIQALKDLASSRLEAKFQNAILLALEETDPAEAFRYHFKRMEEGTQNPKMAIASAESLISLAKPEHLDLLQTACEHPDPLVARLAIQVITTLPFPETTPFLIAHFRTCHYQVLEDRRLQEMIQHYRTRPLLEGKAGLIETLKKLLEGRVTESIAPLEKIGEAEGADAPALIERLKEQSRDPVARFILDALTMLVDGKGSKFPTLCNEALELIKQRALYLPVALNRCAEGLYSRVMNGMVSGDEVQDAITESLKQRTGSAPVIRIFAKLVDPDDRQALALIREIGDGSLHKAAFESLGEREDPRLMDYFFEAMDDPILEVGLVAVEQLQRLPGSFDAIMERLHSSHPDRILQGLRILGHNRVRSGAESILQVLEHAGREDVILAALEALQQIRYPSALEMLLKMFHPGASPRIQIALAETLREMEDPAALRALIDRAISHGSAPIRILALEACARLHPGWHDPLPEEDLESLKTLIQACFEARDGWPHRTQVIQLLEKIYVFQPLFYEDIKSRVQGYLDAMDKGRSKHALDYSQQVLITNTLRELASRANRLHESVRRLAGLPSILAAVPSSGPTREKALQAVVDFLSNTNLILGPEGSAKILDFLSREGFQVTDTLEGLHALCEIASLGRHPETRAFLRQLWIWSQDLPGEQAMKLQQRCLEALEKLGHDETALRDAGLLERILVLEPSAFFRSRLTEPLVARFPKTKVLSAGSRAEADRLLSTPVDLLVTELTEGQATILDWIQIQNSSRRCRWVILATASRDADILRGHVWIKGVLHKPFDPASLVTRVQDLIS